MKSYTDKRGFWTHLIYAESLSVVPPYPHPFGDSLEFPNQTTVVKVVVTNPSTLPKPDSTRWKSEMSVGPLQEPILSSPIVKENVRIIVLSVNLHTLFFKKIYYTILFFIT